MLYYRKFTTAMTVQCDVYADFVRSYVKVVKSLSYCSRKLIVSSTQTKPLTTNIHEMCNKAWLLQHLRVSNHVILPNLPLYSRISKARETGIVQPKVVSYYCVNPKQTNNHLHKWATIKSQPRVKNQLPNVSGFVCNRYRAALLAATVILHSGAQETSLQGTKVIENKSSNYPTNTLTNDANIVHESINNDMTINWIFGL